jgi:GntR family transcriptional regulator
MNVAINTADPRPIYQQIMDEIRRAVVLGTLRSGDALPSLRQLASDLRVNPNTVAQAYRELERDGVVYVRRGQGTFIAQVQPDASERQALVESIAERALLEAHRSGIGLDELVGVLRLVAASRNLPSLVESP